MRRTASFLMAVLPVLPFLPEGAPTLPAQNRLFITAQDLVNSDQSVPLRLDNDFEVFGFEFGITYDTAALNLTAVSDLGTVSEGADFFDGTIDDGAGLVGWGCVFDIDDDITPPEVGNLPAGTNRIIADLVFDVDPAASDGTATLVFEEVSTNPAAPELKVGNRLTNSLGQTVQPTVENGVLTVENRPPVIDPLGSPCGDAGTVFRITGRFFDEPGLGVTVCGVPLVPDADFQLVDPQTIDVTAPTCPDAGCVEVVVATDRGSDSDTQGFCYSSPRITTVDSGGAEKEGDLFTVTGEGFNHPSLSVTVCGVPATIAASTESSIDIIAPPCDVTGPASVVVNTDCGSDTGTFDYVFAGPHFIRGDCNNDAALNAVSDAIFHLNAFFRPAKALPIGCLAACDANFSGALEGVSDPIFLLQTTFSVGFGEPAFPFPGCGPGAESDNVLGCSGGACP